MIDRGIRKKIEWAFYNYPENSKNCAELLCELAERGMVKKTDGEFINTYSISDPTLKAIEAVDKLLIYKWCTVVETVLKRFAGTGKDTLIRLKYFERRSKYKISDELYISVESIKYWLNDIINYTALVSVQLGLIKIV